MGDDQILINAGAIPVIVGIVQVLKRALPHILQDNVVPLATLAIGIGWVLGLTAVAEGTGLRDLGLAIPVGVVTGLAASGFYDMGKTLLGKAEPPPPD